LQTSGEQSIRYERSVEGLGTHDLLRSHPQTRAHRLERAARDRSRAGDLGGNAAMLTGAG